MITVADAHATTTAGPDGFFAMWADMPHWPDWNDDMEWVRLDGPFATGSTGQMKPKGGPKVTFVIDRLVPGREFVDVSLLVGARLTVDHQVTQKSDGHCEVDVTITLTGPLSRVWNLILGGDFRKRAQPDLDNLVQIVEGKQTVEGK
jgi:hypothetical protein